MGEPTKGTETSESLENLSEWYLISEADCVDNTETLSDLFDAETASDVSNLIDDLPVDQGNSLALYNTQITAECNAAIADLKRKFIASPEHSVENLSPRLQAVHISPQRQIKRRLFEDSGLGEDEATTSFTQVDSSNVLASTTVSQEEFTILHSANQRATLLAKFKDKYNVSFCELTRTFKSNKTCTHNWMIVVFAVAEELIEASKTILQQHCEYIQIVPSDFSALYVTEFKNTKNRETVIHLFKSILTIQEHQILCEPPRHRSTAAALYFYKKAIAGVGFKYGAYPQWIASQTILSHQLAAAETFKLSDMVQWAYDNDFTDEAQIAYYYAQYAEENGNAAAFLQSNQQYKYVKDCSAMVKMYKRQELRNMSMGQWIQKCCADYKDGSEWKAIAQFLKFQNVNFISFLIALKNFFKGIPKKTCIVIYGAPDTGKSFFCFNFIKLLHGKIVSYMNKQSHFWLMPLVDGKIGLLDDATFQCWTFLDVNMRNAFDGNMVSIDIKHKNLQQLKLPPMLITTNVEVPKEPTLKYLYSRLTCFEFPNKMPFDESGNPVFNITTESWAMFFRKFFNQLELTEEDGDSADSGRAFCCTTRQANDSY